MNQIFQMNSGFTIIETLVAIILLGLVSSMGIMVFNQLWGNKKIMLKKEAFVYASQEIDRCISEKIYSDTVYTNSSGSLSINRRIEPSGKLDKIMVIVQDSKNSAKKIIELSVLVNK